MLQDFPAGRTLLNLVNRHVSGAIQHEFVAAAELLERQVRDGTTSTTQEPQQPLEAATVVTQAVVQPPSQEAAAEVTFEQLNCIIPRGKFDLSILPGQLLLSSDKKDILIPTNSITGVVILDNVPDKAREGKLLLLLALDKSAGVMNGNVPLDAVLILTSESEQMMVTCASSGQVLDGVVPVVLCSALGLPLVSISPDLFISPDPDFYSSNKGLCAIGAVMKVNPGFLFPLPTALCFVERPPLFIPHSSIQSYDFSRTGGSSSTFDLVVYLHPPARLGNGSEASGKASRPPPPLEFSQIDNAELGRLRSYFERLRLKASTGEEDEDDMDQGGGSTGPSSAAAQPTGKRALPPPSSDDEEEDEDEDESDEDFDPEGSDDGGGKRARRSGEGDAGGGQEGGDGEDESEENSDDESDVELIDEEGISKDAIRNLMAADKKQGSNKTRAAAAASAAAASAGGASGSGSRSLAAVVAGLPAGPHGSRGQAIEIDDGGSEDIGDESEEDEEGSEREEGESSEQEGDGEEN